MQIVSLEKQALAFNANFHLCMKKQSLLIGENKKKYHQVVVCLFFSQYAKHLEQQNLENYQNNEYPCIDLIS